MSRRSKRQRDVGLIKDYVRPRVKTHSSDGEQQISLRTYVYNEELPTPIVITKPIKPRSISSDDTDLEDVFPGPICISCSGVDNDVLVWCSGCGDPFHSDCAIGYPKEKLNNIYRWLCLDCRQNCVSCSYIISNATQIYKCKACWRIIHRKCVDPTLRSEYRQFGWICSHCQRTEPLDIPNVPCNLCDSYPIKNCPSQYSCKRCQLSISSCCLAMSSCVLQYKDYMKLPYLCKKCDSNEYWKSQLLCSWRRKLLIVLDEFELLEGINEEKLNELKEKLDTIEDLRQLENELFFLRNCNTELPIDVNSPQVRIISKFFPFYSFENCSKVDEIEFPLELSFHKQIAPTIPTYSTSLYYSPPCCFCNAKPSYCRLIYLGQDDWCHAACAMWVGIKVNSKGNYSSLLRGLSQGLGPSAPRELDSCKHCGYTIKSSIAAKCQSAGCQKVMHFYCAKIVGWVVIDKFNSYCGRHKPRITKSRPDQVAATYQAPAANGDALNPILHIKQERLPCVKQEIPSVIKESALLQVDSTSIEKKTGKPAAFEKMMSCQEVKKDAILYPTNKAPPPKPAKAPQVDPKAVTSSILSKRPDLTPNEQSKLSKLIDSLFNDDNKTIVYAASSVGGVIPAVQQTQISPPRVQMQTGPNTFLEQTKCEPDIFSDRNYISPILESSFQLPILQSRPFASSEVNSSTQRPLPTLKHMSKQPLPDVTAQPIASTINTQVPQNSVSATNSCSGNNETPILSSLLKTQVPQFDGLDITDKQSSSDNDENETETTKKRKKKDVPIEEIFSTIEEVFIQRGRARPDHNDQAHHWKSKWARGVSPSDLYIAVGGCTINNIGKIHPDASQRFQNALFPQGYEATKWFWSAKNPGNIVKYILNISVLHVPPPAETYVNETICHTQEVLTPTVVTHVVEDEPERSHSPIEYVYSDFEAQEVELYDVDSSPKFLVSRKRSADYIDESETAQSKFQCRKTRSIRDEPKLEYDENGSIVGIKTEPLVTDDDDTEELNVRRSVRVWSNKIKKELVEEPNLIDGWKIPTDDEDLEGDVEDHYDTNFKISPRKMKSKKLTKYRDGFIDSGSSSGASSRKSSEENISFIRKTRRGDFKSRKKGVGRPRRMIDTDSDEEFVREKRNELDDVIDRFVPNFNDTDPVSDERPNNIEIISIEEINKRFASEDEERKVSKMSVGESIYEKHNITNVIENNPGQLCNESHVLNGNEVVESDFFTKTEIKAEGEYEVTNSIDLDVGQTGSDDCVKTNSILSKASDESFVDTDANTDLDEDTVPSDDDIRSIKDKLCNRGSPLIVLERLKDVIGVQKSYEETIVEGVARIKNSFIVHVSEDPDEESDGVLKEVKERDGSPDGTAVEEGEEEFLNQSHSSAISAKETSGLKEVTEPIAVRRSARERKQIRCPVKDCEKNPTHKIVDMLRHINANHPVYYASLITKRHDSVYKICSQCKFLYLNEESYDAHVDYTCKRNKHFYQQYGKDDKFDELDMSILNNDFGWNYGRKRQSYDPARRKAPRNDDRRSNLSPAKQKRAKKESPPKKTRSGRTIKIPQIDGADMVESDLSDENCYAGLIPQFDGQDNQYGNEPSQHPSSFYIGENQAFSGVIPILMPPGPGQSIEQAIAQPVIRMQPVMQQTNVIHVGHGGTVIFPTSQQVNQVQQQRTQQTLAHAPGGTYTFVQSQPHSMQQFRPATLQTTMASSSSHNSSLIKPEPSNEHYFPLNLNSTTNRKPASPATITPPVPPHTPSPLDPLRTPSLSTAQSPVGFYQGNGHNRLGMVDQRLLEQQRLQEHRAKQHKIQQQRLINDRAMKELEQQQYHERQKQLQRQATPVSQSTQVIRQNQMSHQTQHSNSPHQSNLILHHPDSISHQSNPISHRLMSPTKSRINHDTSKVTYSQPNNDENIQSSNQFYTNAMNRPRVMINSNQQRHILQQHQMAENRRSDQADQKRKDIERKRILDEQIKIQMEENQRKQAMERQLENRHSNIYENHKQVIKQSVDAQYGQPQVPQDHQQQQNYQRQMTPQLNLPGYRQKLVISENQNSIPPAVRPDQRISQNIYNQKTVIVPRQKSPGTPFRQQPQISNQSSPYGMQNVRSVSNYSSQQPLLSYHQQIQQEREQLNMNAQAKTYQNKPKIKINTDFSLSQNYSNQTVRQPEYCIVNTHGPSPSTDQSVCRSAHNGPRKPTQSKAFSPKDYQNQSTNPVTQFTQGNYQGHRQNFDYYKSTNTIQNEICSQPKKYSGISVSPQLLSHEQLTSMPKPPQYTDRRQIQQIQQPKPANQPTNQYRMVNSSRYFNVQRSPKIDEAKIEEIKKELQSPPTLSSSSFNKFKSSPSKRCFSPSHDVLETKPAINHVASGIIKTAQNDNAGYSGHHIQQSSNSGQSQVTASGQSRPSIIRRIDSPSISQFNPVFNSQDTTPTYANQINNLEGTPVSIKQEPGYQKPQKLPGPAFGHTQLRVAPGAGPLPGLKHENIPRIGTLREEQRRIQRQQQHVQPQRQVVHRSTQQHSQSNQHGFYQKKDLYNRNHKLQIVQPRNTPVPRSDFLANTSEHRLSMPSRKPWDLNLQPRRQSGIEVVSRGARQDGIEVIGRSNGSISDQSQARQFMQQGSILPSNAQLRPGFQIYNGQLIEVRPTNNYQVTQMPQSQYKQQSSLQSSHRKQNVIHEVKQQKPQIVNQNKPYAKRPGWSTSVFEDVKSREEFLIQKETKKEFIMERIIKKKAIKATKLIWDPIVLDETVMMDALEDATGLKKTLDVGFDDKLDFSPLLDSYYKTKEIEIIPDDNRPKTPKSIDETEQEEYELFFTIVSDDGYKQSGKDLEIIWNEILDSLETSGNFPGAAGRCSRPDVYKAFGFTHEVVRYLLEQLPHADTVPGVYNAKFFPRTHSAQLVARNPKGCMRAQGYCGSRNPTDMFSFLNSEHRDGLKPDHTVRPMNESDLPLTMRFRRMVETSRTSLQVLPSTIHGRGLFARRAYEVGELVIEYAGEVIRRELCDKREKKYDSKGIGTYMFRVDDKFVVDATMDGGRARFINHSCGPNCMSKIITVDGRKHICIIAGRNIDFGEELTYDYKFDRELGDERIMCGCQAPNCRGFMN